MSGLLSEFGDIKNDRKCVEAMQLRVPKLRGLSHKKCCEEINTQVEKTGRVTRYFNREFLEMNENDHCREVVWIWSGYNNIMDEPIYFQFTGEVNPVGAFVGTEKETLAFQYARSKEKNLDFTVKTLEKVFGSVEAALEFSGANDTIESLQKTVEHIEGVTVSSDTETVVTKKEPKTSKFIKLVLNSLLIPNDWNEDNLFHYFSTVAGRLNHCINKNKDCSNFLIYNESSDHVVFNSGLLDKYGKYILVVAEVNSSKITTYINVATMLVVQGKASLNALGFNKADLSKTLERVSFIEKDYSELVFSATLDDFDLENYGRIKHCIEDRKERFPVEVQDASNDVIYADICKNIETALILNKYDHNYIKPTYNRTTDCIEFIVPYHANNDFQKKSELGLLLSFVDGYWQVVTVLEKDVVMKDIRLFSMYSSETF